MKKSIGFYEFCESFRNAGRNDNFSYEAKLALFDYLEEYEESTGEELELDVVAICCDFNEEDVDDIINNYSIDLSDLDQDEEGNVDEDEKMDLVEEYLQEKTCVVGKAGNCFVYQVF